VTDVVLQALENYERMTRRRRWGGMMEEWRLAMTALHTYRRQLDAQGPQQLNLFGGDHDPVTNECTAPSAGDPRRGANPGRGPDVD
jgi:hypothetical protein